MEESRAVASTDNEAERLNAEGMKHQKAGRYDKAAECYQSAANLGSARGWTNLGMLYYEGKIGGGDKTQAYECLLKASDGGHFRGMFNLAQMLAQGDGVKTNIEEAMRLFKLLMREKYQGAQEEYGNLRKLFPHVVVPETDEEKIRSNPHFQSSIQEIPLDELTLGEKIGAGAFGEVIHGRWQGTDVAVKKLVKGAIDVRNFKKEILEETELMHLLRSPRIIGLLGVNFQVPCIVMEYAALGNLSHFLRTHQTSWTVRINDIAVDIALGLGYLHGKNILHRDLKAANILVALEQNKARAKIGDLGLARLKKGINTAQLDPNAPVLGSSSWRAPEVVRRGDDSRKSDIFSMGMTFWELTTGKEPAQRTAHEMELRKKQAEPEIIPGNAPEILRQVITICWSLDPSARPTAYAVAKTLAEYKGEQDNIEDLPTPPSSPSLGGDSYVGSLDPDADPATGYTVPSELVYARTGSAEILGRYRLQPDNGGAATVGRNDNNATAKSNTTSSPSFTGRK